MEALRARIDGLGIAEPVIYPQGDARVVIQLPGVDKGKREEARRTIQGVAFLEFRLVHKNSARWVQRLFDENRFPRGFKPATIGQSNVLIRDREAVKDDDMDSGFWASVRRFAPREGAELMLERQDGETGSVYYRPFYIETVQQLTGKAVDRAMVDYDNLNRPKVSLQFTGQGRRRFAQVTRDYCPRGEKNRESESGRQLAIILDGQLKSAPELVTEIADGRAEITGSFTQMEVRRLANVLRTGALAAPMKIIEERSVDPTLGRDAVRSGVTAAVIAGILVAIFMLGYYLLPGLFANFALLLDFLLLPLAAIFVGNLFGLFGGNQGGGAGLPTLTLPGIAGIALTFGMAVDANVLIYERIREEQKAGKHLGPAVDAGYDRAFSTIFDSNITTLLAAVIMFWQGSGPIRGYAITLSAGILVSMYTAIVVTRMLFNVAVNSGRFQTVKMFSWFPDSKFDFLGKRKLAFAFSLALIVGTGVMFAKNGQKNFGVDFTGGSLLTISYAEPAPVDQVRQALAEQGIEAAPQYQEVGGDKLLAVSVSFENGEKAKAALEQKFAAQKFKVVQQDEVGPQVGRELKVKGVRALVWAIIGMILYITVRFEFGFAVGAIVALLHDAVIAVGLFCLFGRQLSTPMIAAVLTIIGYSVNDTIVVFDRIREQRALRPTLKFSEAANLAINQTLSRTMLTSGTTLLSVGALLIFGGGAMFDLALMLFIGITIGTYSSVFVATPIAQLWHPDRARESAKKPVREANPARA
jgi:SecD/SecF fusion protein